MDDFDLDKALEDMRAAFNEGRGYSLNLTSGHLVIIPSAVVEGMPVGCLIVCQEGSGAVVLDDPNHFNKFVFVKNGFSMQVGDIATKMIRSFVTKHAGTERPQITDERTTA